MGVLTEALECEEDHGGGARVLTCFYMLLPHAFTMLLP